MKIHWITSADEFNEIGTEWDALVDVSPLNFVFLRHWWLRIWWDAYGGTDKLRVLTVREDGVLIGACPLMRVRTRIKKLIPAKIYRFTQTSVSPRFYFLLDAARIDVLRAMINAIYVRSWEWEIVILENVPSFIESYKELIKLLDENSHLYCIESARRSPFISLVGDFDAYFKNRSVNTRSQYRRAWKKANGAGDIVINRITSATELEVAFSKVSEISRKSWKGAISTDLTANIRSEKFYKSFFSEGAKREKIILWLMLLDGKPVAYQLHALDGGITYLLRSDFDATYASHSVGTALQYFIIKDLFALGIQEHDLCGVDYEYKLRLTPYTRNHKTIYLFSRSVKSGLFYRGKTQLSPILGKIAKALRASVYHA